jgi:hypothetical protein
METEKSSIWEYLVVECRNTFEVIKVNDESPEQGEREINIPIFGTKEQNPPKKLHEFLSVKGKEGWEVCSSTYIDFRMGSLLEILKHPLERI